MKTYELLSVISEGGKKGHQAFEELWRLCYQDYLEIAKRYPEVYAPMIAMKKGFSNAIASFVCDYEEMSERDFSAHAYQKIEELFREESAKRKFNTFVRKGRKMDPIHAMKLMAQLYMDNCGISLGDRTLAYDAGSGWLKKYIDDNPEQTEWNDFTCFSEVMPTICAEYDEEEYDHYDIAPMSIEEERKYASSYALTIDEDSAAALCRGIDYLGRSMGNDNHYLLKKVLVGSEKHLDMTEQAIFYNLEDAEEEMRRWTEQNREHLLCYIIQEIPWRKAFRDEPASSLCGWPDEPYLEGICLYAIRLQTETSFRSGRYCGIYLPRFRYDNLEMGLYSQVARKERPRCSHHRWQDQISGFKQEGIYRTLRESAIALCVSQKEFLKCK